MKNVNVYFKKSTCIWKMKKKQNKWEKRSKKKLKRNMMKINKENPKKNKNDCPRTSIISPYKFLNTALRKLPKRARILGRSTSRSSAVSET